MGSPSVSIVDKRGRCEYVCGGWAEEGGEGKSRHSSDGLVVVPLTISNAALFAMRCSCFRHIEDHVLTDHRVSYQP
jgi:hypothetical protein